MSQAGPDAADGAPVAESGGELDQMRLMSCSRLAPWMRNIDAMHTATREPSDHRRHRREVEAAPGHFVAESVGADHDFGAFVDRIDEQMARVTHEQMTDEQVTRHLLEICRAEVEAIRHRRELEAAERHRRELDAAMRRVALSSYWNMVDDSVINTIYDRGFQHIEHDVRNTLRTAIQTARHDAATPGHTDESLVDVNGVRNYYTLTVRIGFEASFATSAQLRSPLARDRFLRTEGTRIHSRRITLTRSIDLD